MAIELFEHNREAYESAVAMLAETGKACVIHPTGTGKSFIGFKLCEDNPDKKVLWLAPSEYIFDTQIENLKKAANGYTPENIEFCTYARLMNMTDEEIAALEPDFIILDEFHRCGSARWGSDGVDRLLSFYKDALVLGLSATNIRYLDNQRDMAKELFDNNIASTLTLGEAIVRGILNPPKYVLSIFSYQKDLEKFEYRAKHAKSKAVRDKAQKYLEALRRKLENADGLDVIFDKHMTDRHGKYIVFTPDYEAMQEYMGLVDSWFWKVDRETQVYSVYSDDPAASKEFDEFKADNSNHLRLLFCIDALNEGIHVDDISGVILMRPTISPIIYKQQIGRALSASKSKEPVIFDIVNNIENLYSIDDIQEEMAAAISYYRALGKDSYIVNETFKLIDKVEDCKSLFDNLEDTLTASWDLMYEKAVEFYNEYGNLNVPTKYITPDGYSLGTWIQVQRKVYNGLVGGMLSPERIAKLDKLGMRWESMSETLWKRYYNACVEYKEKFGDLSPARTFVTDDGIRLGAWIGNLRTNRRSGIKNGFLTDERVTALDELGMVWEVHDFIFERFYNSAVNYLREYGDLNVPSQYVDANGNRLGEWIDKNRKYYREKNPNLTAEEIERLNSIGMMWEKRFDRIWRVQYEELVKYKKRFGNVKVPLKYITESGVKLGEWLNDQYAKYKIKRLPREREEKLRALGVVFEREDPWEERFKLAKAYYEQHHTLAMPGIYNVNGICLSKWVNEQKQIIRGKRKGKSLTPEQIKRLESIGFTMKKQSEIVWEQKYSEVKEHYTKNGRAVVPEKTKSRYGGDLHVWLIRQALSYRRGDMRSDRAEKFKCLGTVD